MQTSSSSPLLLVSPTPRHNFPAQTTLLIGREAELAELGALLENPVHRLITILGSGGIGKTRLALAAAAEQAEVFADGAAFVPLQAISSAAFLVPALLSALDIPLQGQREPRGIGDGPSPCQHHVQIAVRRSVRGKQFLAEVIVPCQPYILLGCLPGVPGGIPSGMK